MSLVVKKMKWQLPAVMIGVALALSGCGNDQSSQRGKNTLKELTAMVKSVGRKTQPVSTTPTDPNVLISNALNTFEGEPLLLILREKTGALAIASTYGKNESVTTWVTRDLISLSLDQGMLTATRGFGNDLMSVDDGGASELVSARQAGKVEKTYRFLDGLDRPNRLIVTCDIAPGEIQPVESGEISVEAQVMRESCNMSSYKFTNTYWIDPQGRMVQSVQWGGAVNGQFVFRQIRW